jgi:hypothetical protein
LQTAAAAIEDLPGDLPGNIKAKELAFRRYLQTPEYCQKKLLADTWCAAFVIKKYFREPGYAGSVYGIKSGRLYEIAAGQPLPAAIASEIDNLSNQYQFFHWHLAFPDVFVQGGFDCVLGNPPWERVKIQEKEWFAERSPEIASAPNSAARKRLIDELNVSNPSLYQHFLDDSRKAEGESHLLRNSGRYPLCGRGDINVYTVFAEGMRNLLNAHGRSGSVLPIGIATDDTTKFFFQDILAKKSLVSLYCFENEEFIFTQVHHATRFCLFTVGSGAIALGDAAEFVFFARRIENLREPERRFRLSPEDIALLNPNTLTCPVFKSSHDAELTKAIYRRVPVLLLDAQEDKQEENPWSIEFGTLFHMANDSALFCTKEQLQADGWKLVGSIFKKDEDEHLPIYEAKMIHQFDHRWGTYDGQTEAQANQGKLPELDEKMHLDPFLPAIPHYWVHKSHVDEKLSRSRRQSWVMGWRDITGATVSRTTVATIWPKYGSGNTLLLLFPQVDNLFQAVLVSSLNSFPADYATRQKLGGLHLVYHIFKQLPIFAPAAYLARCPWASGDQANLRDWILPRTLELVYTAWDLEPFAQDFGWLDPPFRWDDERRFLIRCELDAAFFHMYLPAETDGRWRKADQETEEELGRLETSFATPRDAATHIMDTFPIVRQRDEEEYDGDYRTKRVILEIYDAMQESIRTGEPYQTRLDPSPANPRCCHPPRETSKI